MQPQQPQGPQGQPPYPQGPQPQYPQGPQQYGMSPMPYPPPQKKGMPGWAWGLIIGGVVLFCGFPILALAAIPLITSNTRDARRAEGEQLMGSAVNAARIEYAMTDRTPTRFSTFTNLHDFQGMYYNVNDEIGSVPGDRGEVTCSPVQTPTDGRGSIKFGWSGGQGQITWQ